MKQYICLFTAFAIMFSGLALCESIDLSSFSPEQLNELRQLIDLELTSGKVDKGFKNTLGILKAMIYDGAPINTDSLVDYDAETDPNGLLGTDGSYLSKTDFSIDGYAPGFEGPVGGTIEYFEIEEDAKSRYEYLAKIAGTLPILADRVIYKCGNYVLRTDVSIKSDDAIVVAQSLARVNNCEIEAIFDPKGIINIAQFQNRNIVSPELMGTKISGSGTYISEPISIDQIPARISMEQSENGEYDVWCVIGEKDYSIVDGSYNEKRGEVSTAKAGEYTFLIESECDWELSVEPLKDAEFETISASGDCVTDIYTFSEPCVIAVNAEFAKRDNLFVYAFLETDHGWDKEYILNELEDEGTQKNYKKILKIAKPTRVYFEVDFDKGNWTLDVN